MITLRKPRLVTQPVKPLTQTGIDYMRAEYGTLPGHTCADCKELMRNYRIETVCSCRQYPFSQGNVMSEYQAGHGWRGHWPACGLWRLVYRKRKVEQLELVVED